MNNSDALIMMMMIKMKMMMMIIIILIIIIIILIIFIIIIGSFLCWLHYLCRDLVIAAKCLLVICWKNYYDINMFLQTSICHELKHPKDHQIMIGHLFWNIQVEERSQKELPAKTKGFLFGRNDSVNGFKGTESHHYRKLIDFLNIL